MRSLRLPTVVVFMLAALAVLVVFAATSDTTPGDAWLASRLQSIHDPTFADVLNRTSDFAAHPLLTLMIVIGALTALFLGGLRAAVMAAILPILRFIVPLAKETFERQRPPLGIAQGMTDFSFPSGHAFNAMLVYGMFFYLAGVYLKARWARLLVQGACLWVIVGTALQRVYVGAHWPSDVAGGILLGGLVLAGGVALHRWSLAPERGQALGTRRAEVY
jgi:undecaprenyl-diphosphatase